MQVEVVRGTPCPKCGKSESECQAWRVVTHHFFPEHRGRYPTLAPEERARRRKERKKKWLAKQRALRPKRFCSECKTVEVVKRAQKYCAQCKPAVVKRQELQWRRTSPIYRAQHKAAKNRRKARIRGNGGSFTGQQWRALCDFYHNRCLACGVQGEMTVDHVLPLSKGGRNEIMNVQPLCHSCNVQKGDMHADYRCLVRLSNETPNAVRGVSVGER